MLIKELSQILTEAAEKPINVSDLVVNFPNNFKKVLNDQWGKHRLAFKGLSFFGDDGVYDQLNQVVSKFSRGRDFDGIQIELESVKEYEDQTVKVEYTDKSDPTEYGQEVYLGFSPKQDVLIVAFDTSLQEDLFNENFDEAWESTFGRNEEFSFDNEEHEAVYNDLWDQYTKAHVYLVFELDVVGKKLKVTKQVDLPYRLDKGFYSHGRSLVKQEYPDIIDLRLD